MEQLKSNEIIKKEISNNLRNFMERVILIKNSASIIETILDSHFKFDDKNNILKNLNQHIFEALQCDPNGLIGYLQFNQVIFLKEMMLDEGKYKQLYTTIENLRCKYGFFIRELILVQQAPFLINAVKVSITKGGSSHNIEFDRGDGASLQAMFTSESLMVIMTSLLDALRGSMQDGVYTINDIVLNNYINASENFKKLIDELSKASTYNILQEAAMDIGK